MAIGKREQIVLVSLGALAAIFAIHVMVFNPRAKKFDEVQQEFNQKKEVLTGAEVPRSDQELPNYQKKTDAYKAELTTVVAQLNLDVPPLWAEPSPKPETVNQRLAETVKLIGQLVKLRDQLQGPPARQPALSFLNDRRQDPRSATSPQMGWNIPSSLPRFATAGGLWDVVSQLDRRWGLMNLVSNERERVQLQRPYYNELLGRLGVNAFEVCNWLYVPAPNVFVPFHSNQLSSRVGGKVNTLSTNRYGVLVPELKKLWVAELIWQAREQNSQMTKERLYEILEITVPTDNHLLMANKQLRALIDIIELAQKNQVLEIQQVNLLKPTKLGKANVRIPGQTPPSTATPAGSPGPGGMQPQQMAASPTPFEAIGMGTGIEFYFRATNPNMVQFLFEVTNLPRSYSLDDLYVRAGTDGILSTSTTVEIVTNLENLGGGGTPKP